jgi:hypothetical protein
MKDTGNFLVSTALLCMVFGLGIWRLDFDRSAPAVTDEQRAALARCVPAIELPAAAKVTLRPAAATSSADGSEKQAAPTPTMLQFVSTTQVKLAGTGADGTAGNPLRLRRSDGGFELQPPAGVQQALKLHSNGVSYDLSATESTDLRFGPTDDATYEVRLDQPNDIAVAADGTRTLAAGVRGQAFVRSAIAVQSLQPLHVAPDTRSAPMVLHPIRVSGQPGLSDIAVEINQPGLRFDDGSVRLWACAWLAGTGVWNVAGVSSTRAGDAGNAKLLVALPPGAFPVGGAWHHPVSVAVVSSDGRYAAVGAFTAVSRLWAAAAATVITLSALGSLMLLRGRQLAVDTTGAKPWFSGLFIGIDGDPSLSLWQTFVWTVVTVWGLLYVFIVAGSLLTLTPEMMGLLGIAGTGSVLARWIATSSGSTSRQVSPMSTPVLPAPPRQHLFWQMLSSNGSFDLLKLQLFVFTTLIALYVVGRIADAAAFPTLDVNTLLLMGVSQGVYITSKAVGAGSVARAQTMKAQLDAGAEQIANLRGATKLRQAEVEQIYEAATKQGAVTAGPEMARRQLLEDEIAQMARQLDGLNQRQDILKLDFEKAVTDLGLVVKP